MKILVISPKDPKTPKKLKYLMGGENTYTQILLQNPPKGIIFIHLDEALKKGMVSYSWIQNFFLFLQKFRILPLGPRIHAIKLNINFGLVYAHSHPVYIPENVPLVISDSSSNYIFLQYYLRWPKWRIKLGMTVKRLLFDLFSIADGEVNTDKAKKLFVFSYWAKRKKEELDIKNIRVLYPGLPLPKEKTFIKKPHTDIKILFVGVWFERKGGMILLEVFRKLAKKYSYIYLTILGDLPENVTIADDERIMHKKFVSYDKLKEYYLTHDILVHIPPVIEGYGMTVPEAMSYGMCVIVSNVCVLPEFIEDGISGLIVQAGSESDLERKLILLINNPKLRKKISNGARIRFQEKFSLPVFQKHLLNIFQEASL